MYVKTKSLASEISGTFTEFRKWLMLQIVQANRFVGLVTRKAVPGSPGLLNIHRHFLRCTMIRNTMIRVPYWIQIASMFRSSKRNGRRNFSDGSSKLAQFVQHVALDSYFLHIFFSTNYSLEPTKRMARTLGSFSPGLQTLFAGFYTLSLPCSSHFASAATSACATTTRCAA